VKVASLSQRRFDAAKLQKLNLFETERFFLDVYCLEPGQAQKAHAHAGSDKVYAVLEGKVYARVSARSRSSKPARRCWRRPAASMESRTDRGPGRPSWCSWRPGLFDSAAASG